MNLKRLENQINEGLPISVTPVLRFKTENPKGNIAKEYQEFLKKIKNEKSNNIRL